MIYPDMRYGDCILSWSYRLYSRISPLRHSNDNHAGCFNPVVQIPRSFSPLHIQYIPRNMHTVFALLCFVVVIHWLIFPYPSGLLHWHCGNLTIAPVPAKQPWWIWINTSCEFIMNDCVTNTKQRTTKPCTYFLGYSVDLSIIQRLSALYGPGSSSSVISFRHVNVCQVM